MPVQEPKTPSIIHSINKHFNNEVLLVNEKFLSKFIEGDLYNKEKCSFKSYQEIGSKAIISIFGILLHEESYCEWEGYFYFNTYSRIRADFDRAIANPHIDEIYFHIDSGGGHAAGCFDLVDHIYNNRGSKPIYALVDEFACSGAYAIASACDQIVCPRTGDVGSVGVITYHYDYSAYFQDLGIGIEAIKAGEQKDAGSPYKPLSEDARARIQESINSTYDLFVKTVARNRGISEQAVRETEADVFDSSEALEIKFIDTISGIREFFETETKTEGNNSMPQDLNADTNSVSQATDTLTGMLGLTSKKGAEQVIANVKQQIEADQQVKLDEQKASLTAEFETEKTKAVEEAKEAAVTETLSNQKAVFEACKAVGREDLAGKYMAEGLSLEDAQKELSNDQADNDEQTSTSTSINPTSVTKKNNKPSAAVEKLNKIRNGSK